MTPAEFRAAVYLLTGDVTAVADSLGLSRRWVYKMLAGDAVVQPDVAARIAELLRERRDAIDRLIWMGSAPF